MDDNEGRWLVVVLAGLFLLIWMQGQSDKTEETRQLQQQIAEQERRLSRLELEQRSHTSLPHNYSFLNDPRLDAAIARDLAEIQVEDAETAKRIQEQMTLDAAINGGSR